MKSASIPFCCWKNSEAFIEEVVPHELAHLLVWKHFGRVVPTWQRVEVMMESVLGFPPVVRISSNCNPCVQHLSLPLQVPGASRLTVRRHNGVVRGRGRLSLCSLR